MEYNVPQNILIENKDFSICGVKEHTLYAKETINYMNDMKPFLLNFFEIDSFDKVRIHLFESRESIIKWRSQFGEMSYAIDASAGYIYHNMIFFYADFTKVKIEEFVRSIAHEYVHLIYNKEIREKEVQKRVVWVDEGLADFLSDKQNGLLNPTILKNWFLNRIIGEGKKLPHIDFLKKHGSYYGTFCDLETNTYNGYDISYMLIRYLYETLTKENFQKIIRKKRVN